MIGQMLLQMLSKVAQEVMVYALPILISTLVAWLLAKVKMAWNEAKLRAGDWGWVLDQVAITAVQAAEQMGLKDKAFAKKAYAVEVVQKYLDAKGISIDLKVIDAAIEAAVLREFNQKNI